ncbi:MAG: LysR family transcriptional regulator [Deltaproteobacteria bacterium]|nr:LysR family transcriptional regulator [Deltaproteobacteria bacterium]
MRVDLNLKQIKVFYFVARHLSFTQAAKELFITQPAVTKQVEGLEQHCETRLFVRDRHGLSLTEAGQILYSYTEQIMRLASEAEQAVSNLKHNPHGVLRVGTTKTFARYLMPPYMLRFHEAFPKIRIQLDEGSSQEMAASVLHGHNDLAVVGRVPYDVGIEPLPFPGRESDRLVVVVAPAHRLAGAKSVTLADIRDEPLLLREKGSGVRRLVLERFEQMGIRPNILLEAGNVDFAKELIRRGAGIGILGLMSIEEELQDGSLAAVPLDSEGFVIHIDLLLPREGYRPVAARSFLEFLLGPARPAEP